MAEQSRQHERSTQPQNNDSSKSNMQGDPEPLEQQCLSSVPWCRRRAAPLPSIREAVDWHPLHSPTFPTHPAVNIQPAAQADSAQLGGYLAAAPFAQPARRRQQRRQIPQPLPVGRSPEYAVLHQRNDRNDPRWISVLVERQQTIEWVESGGGARCCFKGCTGSCFICRGD